MVVDRTRENCKSWQTLTFERRPVVFIRIIGTHNTANEVFHCVHFECPAQTDTGENKCSPPAPAITNSNNNNSNNNNNNNINNNSKLPTETATEAAEVSYQGKISILTTPIVLEDF